jgi:hypothetical protein
MAFELFFPDPTDLPAPDHPELLNRLAARLGQLLQEAPEILYQLLYRLDVPEHQIAEALQAEQPAHALARYVLDRELQKTLHRQQSSGPGPEWIEKDLSW